ncbi:MAG TPA: hypothetical protein VGN88_08175 [Phycisphaerae bacterium]|jgi:hypothetical protein
MSENLDQQEAQTAGQRHWLYGFNVVVLVIVGLVALTMILIVCDTDAVRKHTRWDWSSTGANSLSSGSKKMLAELDQHKEKITLISLFTDPSEEEKREQTADAAKKKQHREQINDLLRQYEKNSTYITREDDGDSAMEDLKKRIREKYKTELEPYEKAVSDFSPLVKEVSEFLKNEAPKIGASGQGEGATPDDIQLAAVFQAKFASAPDEFDSVERAIRRESSETLPSWNTLADDVKEIVNEIEPMFELLNDPEKLKAAKFPPRLADYFTAHQAEYKKIGDKLKDYKARLDKLERLKVDDVLSSLDKDTVVILGDTTAKVLSPVDLYTPGQASRGSADTTEVFNGEQAISSALFAMTNKEKVKVVFVTASAEHMLSDTYSDMQQLLQQNNFDVQEWNPPGEPQPGSPPESSTPPAEGKGVVWVVFTPGQPNQQQMMMGMGPPNPAAVIAATKKHMDEGGAVLFMAEASAASPFMPGGGGYPYNDLIKDFGIDVQSKFTVMHLQEGDDPDTGQHMRQLGPFIDIEQFEDHEITTPMQSLPTMFGPDPQTGQGMATAVTLRTPIPTGVEAKILVKTPFSSDYWGETDPSPDTAKFDKDVDMSAPVPMAAASVRNKGQKDKEQRVAVIGAKMLGSNAWQNYVVRRMVGGVIYQLPRFPGNTELMKNTILWLAGYENMIAVSARADQGARIGQVKDGAMFGIRLVVLALFPLAALVAGGLVWAARRR